MEEDYFSIDAILAENQKIQCTFRRDIPDMGHLGGGNTKDIKAGAKVAIPIWLAYVLIYSEWVDFTIPTAFGPKVKNALSAEEKSVRLSGLVGAGSSWYSFGKTVMDILIEEQGKDMSDMLTRTFHKRLLEIIDQAQHFAALGPVGGGGSGNAAQSFREGLDATERDLFTIAQESAKRTKKWYEETERGRR
ncbi:uncharacterized protein SCHCODRAFT_02623594 [Schizophyllum commune H4-8]|uniref:DNA replication complex GINS protein PSF3 n=1 Tax=Schizophyllum commune (strain H4-8 / FGSC 9210) TaxID=578458 RepID=D8PJZ5_SCHCM|nr:uncharacterized protein SCHCODRAFT_02623594 [Schizophyllum commune H4-8]KAI5894055.1 hypothetical protein SCHCODRAFT_02623594 [Schizophyllum commune H4-8]